MAKDQGNACNIAAKLHYNFAPYLQIQTKCTISTNNFILIFIILLILAKIASKWQLLTLLFWNRKKLSFERCTKSPFGKVTKYTVGHHFPSMTHCGVLHEGKNCWPFRDKDGHFTIALKLSIYSLFFNSSYICIVEKEENCKNCKRNSWTMVLYVYD